MQGEQSFAGLVSDDAGSLFGTTYAGGVNHKGVVFELSPVPGKPWRETVLWSYQGKPDGAHPYATLVRGASGRLCGTTFLGGAAGHGSVFEVAPFRP